MGKNRVVAMVLAGGRGSRLAGLTKKNAKPAVSYGGKYRIIDFVLSNLANSNINNVGLITQYETIELGNYASSGKKWGFDGNNSTFDILSPREKQDGSSWYKGTADAIYQNIDYMESLEPDYVLILSSDHIYKMNYSKMLNFMISKNADLVIACIDVGMEEASRFGILECDEDYKINKFIEKPKHPTSSLASMGIYIFKYKLLKDALNLDAKNPNSSRDFGKDIIPYLLSKGKKLVAYPFEGYWRDVGTLSSLWEANMDLLDDSDCLSLYDDTGSFKVYSEDTRSVPQYIGPNARVTNSMINQGSVVLGFVDHSVIFTNAYIGEGCVIKDSVIMPNAVIKDNVVINKAIISPNITIEENRQINVDGKDVVLIER